MAARRAYEMAGVAPGDYQVEPIDNGIVVKGSRRFEKKSEDAEYLSSERIYGFFERAFPLPRSARPESMQTTLSNGILEIVVPLVQISEPASSGTQVKKAAPQGIETRAGQDKDKKG